jgi:hypothetical protein
VTSARIGTAIFQQRFSLDGRGSNPEESPGSTGQVAR